MNEKLAALEFPQCMPADRGQPRSAPCCKAFVAEHGDAVLKPLDGMGGRSIFRVRAGDPNTNVILETLTEGGRHLAMAQRYLPEITEGDKRILLIDGVPVDYCLARIPQGDEFRGNLAAGGKGRGQPLSERDRWIAAQVGPELKRRGMVFVGPGRDRRLPDRGQRHQPHLHPRARRPVRPEHRRAAVRRHRAETA